MSDITYTEMFEEAESMGENEFCRCTHVRFALKGEKNGQEAIRDIEVALPKRAKCWCKIDKERELRPLYKQALPKLRELVAAALAGVR